MGEHSAAEEAYRKAIELRPDFADAINNLGMLMGGLGKLEEAIELFRRAIRLDPAEGRLHNNLGAALNRKGNFEDAAASFQKAVDLKPKYVEALSNLGTTLRLLGELKPAAKKFRAALKINDQYWPAHVGLAETLKDLGLHKKALAEIDHALTLRGNFSQGHFLRSMILRDMQRYDESIDAVRHMLRLDPDDQQGITSLAYALLERGDMDEAMEALNRSVALRPNAMTLSNVLMTANYHPGYAAADLLAMHRVWAELHEAPHRPGWGNYANDRTPNRKLRIGYVSPDFRGHVVAHFLEPILENHDHDQFEVFGYANLRHFDMHTWKIRSQVDQWREIADKSDVEIAAQIRKDRIDILIELAGHTGGNALPVFARKPAPVQINMIGFPSTTGLSAMDYRVTDARCDPPGQTDPYNSERLLRMPRLWWVFNPTPNSPEVGPLPADKNGYLTFTSVNNFTKVTSDVQRMWARLLLAVPNSRLIFQQNAMNSEHTTQAVRRRFAEMGVDTARLEFRPMSDLHTFFKLLNESDLTLDPFPFNGGTTTCQSLWMGAPVLTLAGERHASRMGLSMMTAIGLPEFVAHSPAEYIEIGRCLAGDLPHLREVRRGMRERLLASPLLDGAGYTRELEAKYRQVWTEWCASSK
jgi:predicted O-linked N-acetylglucosamine transferase (SPINDLY family)